ncbi:nuclease-related domain-containing protein [Corticicoccus populi]|uniref:Nuclease-related domain-containing protein n=1 Tax=Corticicoccus populi TaxID=1812821 RepID=A0ABW5WQ84_9STAP
MNMNTDIFTEPIFIIVAAVLLIILIWFLVYFFKHRKEVNTLQESYDKEKKELVENYESQHEEERLGYKKEISTLNEKYYNDTTLLDNKLSSLQQFTVDKGEYLTDLALIQLKDRLVRDEKIRESDMHILSNVYIPSRNYTNTRKIDHLVLTRTGIYLLDSKYWRGHILHGVNETNFEELPYIESFFDLLNLDKKQEQTLIFDKDTDDKVAVNHYNEVIEETKVSSEKLRNILKLQYEIVPIIYFNPKDNGNYSISNYSDDQGVKVLVGTEELDAFFMKYVFHGRFQYTVKDLDEIADAILSLNP